MEQGPSWEADRFLASQKLSTFYRTQRFITTFTTACYLALFWVRSIQSMPPHPISWRIQCPFSISQDVPKHQSKAKALTNFCKMAIFTVRIFSTSPNPQAGESCFNGCLQLLIQYIHSYPPYCRQFLHPQPEDAPCHLLQGPIYRRLNNMYHGNWMVDISAYDLELNCGVHCDLHCHDNHI